jgi:hypothetical protein
MIGGFRYMEEYATNAILAVWAFVVGIIFIFLPVAVGVVLGIYESAECFWFIAAPIGAMAILASVTSFRVSKGR